MTLRIRKWFALRGPNYVGQRAAILLERYGVRPTKAANRAELCVLGLAEMGCQPTFFTPGRVVQRYPEIVRNLQSLGAEIAVHGYDHFDLTAYTNAEATAQLMHAVQVFHDNQLEIHGFRCPYLGCTNDLLDSLPPGLFRYSSNKAVIWNVFSNDPNNGSQTVIFDVLSGFYKASTSASRVAVPYARPGMVEIPVSLPDDLQLHDGLKMRGEGMTAAWTAVFAGTYKRGEAFVLQFHPELFMSCQQPFASVFAQIRSKRPAVWVTRMRDIASWWQEKAKFGIETTNIPGGLRITFQSTDRATVLVRGIEAFESQPAWDGQYRWIKEKAIEVPADPRPFVGLGPDVPPSIAAFLAEQGYTVETGDTAACCGTYIDGAKAKQLGSEVALVDYIETSTAPLVRYWRWPQGFKSAISITGDLDALSLLDYASRLFVKTPNSSQMS